MTSRRTSSRRSNASFRGYALAVTTAMTSSPPAFKCNADLEGHRPRSTARWASSCRSRTLFTRLLRRGVRAAALVRRQQQTVAQAAVRQEPNRVLVLGHGERRRSRARRSANGGALRVDLRAPCARTRPLEARAQLAVPDPCTRAPRRQTRSIARVSLESATRRASRVRAARRPWGGRGGQCARPLEVTTMMRTRKRSRNVLKSLTELRD